MLCNLILGGNKKRQCLVGLLALGFCMLLSANQLSVVLAFVFPKELTTAVNPPPIKANARKYKKIKAAPHVAVVIERNSSPHRSAGKGLNIQKPSRNESSPMVNITGFFR